MQRDFERQVQEIINDQGTEEFVRLTLDELDLEYVEDLSVSNYDYFINRSRALFEESL